MVAHGVEGAFETGEEPLAVVGDFGNAAVHDLLGGDDLRPESLADALMAQTDAQHGNALCGGLADQFGHDPGAGGTAGAGGKDDGFGVHGEDLVGSDFPVALDDDVGFQRVEQMHEIIGERVVVVENENHFTYPPVRNSPRQV